MMIDQSFQIRRGRILSTQRDELYVIFFMSESKNDGLNFAFDRSNEQINYRVTVRTNFRARS